MKKLLITVAINEEFKAVCKLIEQKKDLPKVAGAKSTGKRCEGMIEGYPIEVVMTSMGCEASQRAIAENLDPAVHGGVLVVGYCGGLALSLRVGDAFIPNAVYNPDNTEKVILDQDLCEILGKILISEGLGYKCGPLITQRKVIETPQEKQQLFEKTHAEAVDMESFEIVSHAFREDLRSAVLRIVTDDSETELPHFNEYFQKKGSLEQINVAPLYATQPGLTFQLSKNMKMANGIFKKVLVSLVKATCEHWSIQKI